MIRFSEFRDNYCKHQGAWFEFDEGEGVVKACGFKDGKPARSWADWQKCCKENCPVLKGDANERSNDTV